MTEEEFEVFEHGYTVYEDLEWEETAELERVKKECGKYSEVIQIWQMDLSKPRECLQAAKDLNLDRLDILVNNGGISQRTLFDNCDYDTHELVMNTNTMSLIALCNAFMPLLKKSKGQVVNISSICGLLGITYRTSYAASKFAVTGFSKALRAECAPHGVSVTVVYPGYICTNISKNA